MLGNFGCASDGPAPTKLKLLTTPRWRLVSAVQSVTVNGVTTTRDVYAQDYYDCSKDDFCKFNTDLTLVYDEGPIKCGGAQQSSTGDWAFANNETELVTPFNTIAHKGATIEELSIRKMRLNRDDSSPQQPAIIVNTAMTYTAF